MRPKKRGETWVYPHSADVLREARLKTVAEYIAKRRQTVHRTIADRPILEECRGGEEAAWEPSPPSMVGAGLRGGGVVEGSGRGGGDEFALGLSHVAARVTW